MIQIIGGSLTSGRSLLAIHLSDNPGLTEETYKYLTQTANCQPIENMKRFEKIQAFVMNLTKETIQVKK